MINDELSARNAKLRGFNMLDVCLTWYGIRITWRPADRRAYDAMSEMF